MTDKQSYAPKGPTAHQDISDRILDCEFDLEPLFMELLDKASTVGWTRAEAALALCGLGDNWLLAQVANAKTAEDIKKALNNLRKPES